MELIDRYVQEVGRHLPRKNRSDIQAELQSTLVDTLEARLDDGLMHPNLAASQINEAGLSQSYAEMLDAYDTTHILDRDALHGISQAVGVRYYALPILVNFRETTTSRFSVFGLRLGKQLTAPHSVI